MFMLTVDGGKLNMARVLSRSNRPIIIQEPQSGLDTFLTEIAKYASPEYQQQRKANERADARFELDKQNAVQNREYRQQQMETAKAQESDRKIQFRQQQKSIKDKKAMDEFTMMYPETLSAEGLDIAEQFLNNNLAESSSFGVLSAKIKSDRNNLNVSNKKLDSFGELIFEDEYDPIKHRNLVEKQGSFLIQNKLKQDMFNELSQSDRLTLTADIEFISDAIESARDSEVLKAGSYDIAIKNVVKPTYESMKKAYGEDFKMPALEGIIRGVDPAFGVDDDVPIGNKKIMEETDSGQETDEDLSIGTFASQVSDSIPTLKTKRNKELDNLVISSLIDEESGKLRFLESAADEESVLKPAGTNIRKAVKSVRSNLNKQMRKLGGQYIYGTKELAGKEITEQKRQEYADDLKKSLLDAVNLYKSIDPNIGRKNRRGKTGGESERKVIKKAINDLKARTKKSANLRGGINYLPQELLDFINNINLDSNIDTRVLVDYNKKQNPVMMTEDDGSFLESLLPTALQASQNNIPSPLDNFILESATE
jgi:hypothetical protein